ncbi:MAG: hypothetical protein U1F34_09075 [Gammaproteobacteria bacterium]
MTNKFFAYQRGWLVRHRRQLASAASVLAFSTALAQPAQTDSGQLQPVQQAVQQSLKPVSKALNHAGAVLEDFAVGPRNLEFSTPQQSCTQIYDELVRLTPRTYNYKPSFYDDPRNEALGMLGFVFTPAFYGWAVTSLDEYSEGSRIRNTGMRINSLRYAAAKQDCWVRE